MSDLMDKAVEAIRKGGYGTALTGAGISAESGIPTYRDPGNLYDQYDQGAQGGMLGVLMTNPEKAPEILNSFFNKLQEAKPNAGHIGLVELEKMGLLKSVITQNVDGLHRLAGNSKVLELHGSIYRMLCTVCGKKKQMEKNDLFAMTDEMLNKLGTITSITEILTGILPPCSCGGPQRFDFVSFGESVQELNEAVLNATSCTWMLIVGTSGVVNPAAMLPAYAKKNDAFLIEINPKESELTSQCDIFLKGAAGQVVPELVSALRKAGIGNK